MIRSAKSEIYAVLRVRQQMEWIVSNNRGKNTHFPNQKIGKLNSPVKPGLNLEGPLCLAVHTRCFLDLCHSLHPSSIGYHIVYELVLGRNESSDEY